MCDDTVVRCHGGVLMDGVGWILVVCQGLSLYLGSVWCGLLPSLDLDLYLYLLPEVAGFHVSMS